MIQPVENIVQRLQRQPMLMVLAGLIAGIVLADCLRPDVWVVAVGFVVACGVAYRFRWAMMVAVIMTGMFALTLRREAEQIPQGERLMQIELHSPRHSYSEWHDFDARVVALHNGEKWQRTSLDVRLRVKPSLELQAGERIISRARLRGYDGEQEYGRYMRRVGVTGVIYIDSADIIGRETSTAGRGARLRQRAMQRIERLGLSHDVESVVAAMSIGERSTLEQPLRQSYVRAGGAHLLAVSGLHVGFLFVLVNLLLFPMAALRDGQLWRSVVAVMIIWLYAMMVGFSPSVVRAAVMFSLVQVMITLASGNALLNSLSVAAFVMLVWNARTLYDAGFQLSVLAVAAIVVWGVDLIRWLVPPLQGWEGSSWWHRLLRWVWRWAISAVVVSFVASVATMPLSSYLFGELSLWSMVVGGVMVALCAVTVGVALLWVIAPVGIFGSAVAWVLELSAGGMNSIAKWCAGVDIMSHQIEISSTACWMIYLGYLLFTLALWSLPRRE